jgi:hypothetical protein
MLQNGEPTERAMSEPSEPTPPLALGSAYWLALWANERANTLARSARGSEIIGSARLGSLPTLHDWSSNIQSNNVNHKVSILQC